MDEIKAWTGSKDHKHVLGQTQLDAAIYELIEGGWMMPPIKNGPKYKQIPLLPKGVVMPIKLDLFIATPPAQWGLLMVIRTGPNKPDNNFSKWCVTQRHKGGCLPNGVREEFGAVWNGEDKVEKISLLPKQNDYIMPEEIDFLNFIGLGWIEPKDRVAQWKR